MDRMARFCDRVAQWCVFAIVFAAPFSKSIAEIGIGVAIAAWLIKRCIRRDASLPGTPLTIPLVIYMACVVISVFNSPYLALSLKAVVTKALKYVVFYFAVLDTMDREGLRDLFIVALIGAAVIAVDGLVQHYMTGIDLLHAYPSFKARLASSPDGFYRGFPTASFPFPNDFAAWILLVIFPIGCAALFDLRKTVARFGVIFLAAALFFLLFLTKARAAWGAFAISTVYVALSKRKIWLVLLLVLMVAIPYLLNMEMSRYIFGTSSLGDRLDMWQTSWEIFKEHPFFGSGINTYFENFKRYRTDRYRGEKGSYAHNCYLQMACDLGLAGLLAFLVVIGTFFYSVVRALRRVTDDLAGPVLWGLSIGIFAFLAHSFFDTNLYSLNLAILFWTAMAVSQSVIKVYAKPPRA